MRKFFDEKITRQFVSFFLLVQLIPVAILIIALFVANDAAIKWLDVYLLVYSPLNVIMYKLGLFGMIPPMTFVIWVSPLLCLMLYSLCLGGLAAYIKKRLRRT